LPEYTITLAEQSCGFHLFLGATSPTQVPRPHTTSTDNLNITGITDNPARGLPSGRVTTANNQTLAYSAANRLNSASGSYGAYTWTYDGVGTLARASGTTAPLKTPRPWGGALTPRVYTYPATSNKISGLPPQ
jgi:hypothetical protein